MSISLTSVFVPPAKPDANGSSASSSSTELDFFRAELLRQKIVFESELRRQREVYEDKIEQLVADGKARDAELKQTRQTVHALGLRVESLESQGRAHTPRRAQSPVATPRAHDASHATGAANTSGGSAAVRPNTSAAADTPRGRAASPLRRTPSRQPSPVRGPAPRPALNSALSRLSSATTRPAAAWR